MFVTEVIYATTVDIYWDKFIIDNLIFLAIATIVFATAYSLVHRDVVRRIVAEETVRESQVEIHALLEHSPDIIQTVSRDGKTLYINRTPPDFAMKDVIGMNFLKLFPKKTATGINKPLIALSKTESLTKSWTRHPTTHGGEHASSPSGAMDG